MLWLTEKVYPEISAKIAKKKSVSRKYMDEKRKLMGPLKEGQVVFAHDPLRKSKWEVMYEGPFQVVGCDAKGNYVLKDTDGTLLGRHWPVDMLKVTKRERW
jgi:hypothetical protein